MATKSLPSPKALRDFLHYDPKTGAFTYKARPENSGWDKTFNKRFAGKPALRSIDLNGYCVGTIKSVKIYGHRVAWAWMTGEWPSHEIDHLDGDRKNNAFANLRAASRAENAKNLGSRKRKASDLPKGVFNHNPNGPNPYRAQIAVNKTTVHLGCFPDVASASRAYQAAAMKYGFSERHAIES